MAADTKIIEVLCTRTVTQVCKLYVRVDAGFTDKFGDTGELCSALREELEYQKPVQHKLAHRWQSIAGAAVDYDEPECDSVEHVAGHEADFAYRTPGEPEDENDEDPCLTLL